MVILATVVDSSGREALRSPPTLLRKHRRAAHSLTSPRGPYEFGIEPGDDERLVQDAARLKADHPIAHGDAFGAALAITEDATPWTGDPELLIEGSRWHWRDLRRRG